MPEMAVIRGICKRNFPSPRARTIDVDVPGTVKRLKGGLKVALNSSDREPDYGYIEVPIGTVNVVLLRNRNVVWNYTINASTNMTNDIK